EFARKFGLDVIEVISGGDISKEAWTGDGILVNSGILNGLNVEAAVKKIIDWLEEHQVGKATIQFKLRDWVFSRQRYWGEPFPLKFNEKGDVILLDEDELPLVLPEVEKYEPSGTGESPLANVTDWIDFRDAKTGEKYSHETNTMPQWAGSCWYYLRYIDPNNNQSAWDPKKEQYWMPVDLYIGGAEHAVLHLLYARFWHKVLYDLGFVSTSEPFQKLINQGMILGEDGEKMSKSRGNVINPDEVIEKFGADSFRMYEMFMGPLTRTKPWSTSSIDGIYRFLNRTWNLFFNENNQMNSDIQDIDPDQLILVLLNKTIYKVTKDTENLHFNTAISQFMIFINEIIKLEVKPLSVLKTFIQLLNPYAPHITEEIWRRLDNKEELSYIEWPAWDDKYLKEDNVMMAVQINGKVRGNFEIERDSDDDNCISAAKDIENVKRFLEGKQIIKKFVVKNKIVSFVIR
ncbi:MAG: leucine--tRNA ligase, partial [Candidatus Marinimicrobia bacterium]|nr:leucine--tRNA ligase [Candidatus Neomarinimicrobiota bacterium]